MKKISLTVFIFLLAMSMSFAQGGIYSIVDPKNASTNNFAKSTLGQVLGDDGYDVSILEYHGSWKDEAEAKFQLIQILNRKETEVSSAPLWNMDIPIELVGQIKYTDGSIGKIAVSQHRVGFQDKIGKPWCFQWQDRAPLSGNKLSKVVKTGSA